MLFSIRKHKRFQVLFKYFRNPTSTDIQESVDEGFGGEIRGYLKSIEENTKKHVDGLMNGSKNILSDELSSLGIQDLKAFFLKYPSAWLDLKRKIHKHRTFDEGKYSIKKSKEEHIYGVFLRLKRDFDGQVIESAIRKEILNNQSLISRASREPSLLDSSHGMLSFMASQKESSKLAFLEKIIIEGIRGNNDIGVDTENAINEVFFTLLPQIINYLKSIFNLSFEDFPKRNKIRSIKDICKYLSRKLWGDFNLESKKAWMFIKAFYAWGNYANIEKIREKGESQIRGIEDKLQKSGIESKVIRKYNISGNEEVNIFEGSLQVPLSNGIKLDCKMEYRLKSMRSILLKMWENEDYNNVDAIKDILGLAIIFPENATQEQKAEVIKNLTELMSDKGYLLKTKGLLDSHGLRTLEESLKNTQKKPLGGIVSTKKGKTDSKFTNVSISGFTRLGEEPIGLEIQFFDNSGYNFWKKDHYTYDPLKIISAWSRGSWFLTPNQVLHCIVSEIPPGELHNIGKTPHEIFYMYLQKGKLIPYLGGNGEVYITTSDNEVAFTQKFKSDKVRRIIIDRSNHIDRTHEDRRIDHFKEYIFGINLLDVVASTPGASSLPPFQDQ